MPIRTQRPFSVLAAAAAGLTAGPLFAQESQVRDLAGFDAIEVGGNIELAIRQGESFRVEVSGSEDALERLVTTVEQGTLIVRRGPESLRWFDIDFFDTVNVSVTLPQLTQLQAVGGADVHSEGRLTGERLRIESSGGADIEFEVEVSELEVRTSGGSDSTVSGRADRIVVQSSGGSDFSGRRLTVSEADIRSSGGSDVVVDVSERLVARASGGSDIDYHGKPAYVDVDASGGADVSER